MPTTVPISGGAVYIVSGETLIGQVPAGKEWNIAVIRFCNIDPLAQTITIATYDPAFETFGDLTTEYKHLSIGGKTTFEYGPLILPQNRRIAAIADVSGNVINARIHGWEVTP